MEEPIMRRRDRIPTITVRGDIAENLQPPDVSAAITKALQPVIDTLPAGYRIEQAGSIEESGKATKAMVPLFPYHDCHDAVDYHPPGAVDGGDGDGLPDRAAGADWGGANAAALQPAFWHQYPRRADCAVRHSDAQHPDPDRPDPSQRAGGAGALPCGGRGDGAACPAGIVDGDGCHTGVYPADALGVLGDAGLR